MSCGLKPLPGRSSAVLNVGFLLVTAHCRSLIELRVVLLHVSIKKKKKTLITKRNKTTKKDVAITLQREFNSPR